MPGHLQLTVIHNAGHACGERRVVLRVHRQPGAQDVTELSQYRFDDDTSRAFPLDDDDQSVGDHRAFDLVRLAHQAPLSRNAGMSAPGSRDQWVGS